MKFLLSADWLDGEFFLNVEYAVMLRLTKIGFSQKILFKKFTSGKVRKNWSFHLFTGWLDGEIF